MAITARPRRSTAGTVSYANLFAPGSSSPSSSSSSTASDSDDEGNEPSGGRDASDRKQAGKSSKGKNTAKKSGNSSSKNKAKVKGKARALSSDEDSGSVFGSSDAAEEEEEAADDDDQEDELADATDDDDAGSEPERSDAESTNRDSISGTTVKVHRKVLKPTFAKGNAPAHRAHTRTDLADSKRAQPPGARRRTLMDINWMNIGASYEPPYRALDEANDSQAWTIRSEEEAEVIDDEMQSRFMETWAMHPFGIHKTLVRDNAWEKGKWTAMGLSPKWGGWYESKAPTSVLPVKESTAYLPFLVYPSRPAKIYLDEEPAAEQDDNNEANPAAMPVDEDEGEAGDDQEPGEGVKIWVGPLYDENEQQLVQFKRFETHRLDEYLPNKPGHILNAGGPVSGLAWCPRPDPAPCTEYLVVSCFCSAEATLKMTKVPGPTMIQLWSLDTSNASDISLVTSPSADAQMKFEMALCIELGDAWELKWCPRGGDRTKFMDQDDAEESLGLLGGVFEDGSVAVFTVPNPVEARKRHKTKKDDTLYCQLARFWPIQDTRADRNQLLTVKAKPTLRLELPDTKCTCFDWASHEMIVAGCNNGWVAVWSVSEALRSGGKYQTVRPTHYFIAHFTIIRSIAVIRVPPLSTALDGSLDLDGEPTTIATTGYDGSVIKTDLRDLSSAASMHHERSTGVALAYCSQSGLLLNDDPEGRVRASVLKPNKSASRVWISTHTGPIWSIDSSPHHPFAASAGADGCLIVANTIRPNRDRIVKGNYGQKVYRLDFHRKSGEFRMIDNMLPEVRPLADIKKGVLFRGSMTTATWSPEVGIARVVWNPALDRCALLASGTICGLVRVDWCEGGKGVA
ncbi:BQ2448_4783 [Microbotryum intermedium]|uniref:BQ2448_4783 protein n=1 Tax=Microbotryum intermedium TaxID=269621 RepID=A0A238FH17_9BASI|nr:BQ2448_4783 [Microbotryum intermedium]